MALKVKLSEVITPQMIVQHRDHIQDFLLQEGIEPDRRELGETTMTERQVKELLEELASDIHE